MPVICLSAKAVRFILSNIFSLIDITFESNRKITKNYLINFVNAKKREHRFRKRHSRSLLAFYL